MSDDKDSGWRPGCGLGVLYAMAGISALVMMFRLGPMDSARTVYNQIIGDVPAIKRQLTDYARKGIQKENQEKQPGEVEKILAQELGIPYDGNKINPNEVSIEQLWDASEDHARSWYQRWVWPSVDE